VIELSQADAALRVAIATLIGLAVGLERQWSGHATGPLARFAGLRTFLLLGLLGGGAGVLLDLGHAAVAAAIVAVTGLFAVVAYVMAVRRPEASADGTTEAAALVVLALGALSGIGFLGLAAGAGALTVFALSEKARLHWMVGRVDERELRAALQFAVLALVVLPLLPEGPYLGALEFRPRLLWALVLVFSGLNFAGYIARRAIGPDRGYGVAGALGGLVSSTAVTLTFSRHSRVESPMSASLARGILAACTVMVVRVITMTAALALPVAEELLPMLLPAALVGAIVVAVSWRNEEKGSEPAEPSSGNPLRLWSAMKMAALFQAGITAIALVSAAAGDLGLFVTGVLLGVTDVDALTVSMTRSVANVSAETAARVIAVGVLADTVFKLGLSAALGAAPLRTRTVPGLALLAAACGVGLWLL
jgi:uncharacterized membrane protein (DUF4010 family)